MASRGIESWCRARTVQTIRPQQSVPAVRDNRPPDVSTKRRMFWWGTRDANEVWLPTGGSVMALRALKGFGKGNLWGFLQGVGGQKKHVWRYCTCYFFSLGINYCGLHQFFSICFDMFLPRSIFFCKKIPRFCHMLNSTLCATAWISGKTRPTGVPFTGKPDRYRRELCAAWSRTIKKRMAFGCRDSTSESKVLKKLRRTKVWCSINKEPRDA